MPGPVVPEPYRFDCGCWVDAHVTDDGQRVLHLFACEAGCLTVATYLRLADEKNKPVTIVG